MADQHLDRKLSPSSGTGAIVFRSGLRRALDDNHEEALYPTRLEGGTRRLVQIVESVRLR